MSADVDSFIDKPLPMCFFLAITSQLLIKLH